MSETGTRCGFVALIGAPNVGKSTLVNALVGSKVTIVSRKVQTTRALIRGIVVENNAQIIFFSIAEGQHVWAIWDWPWSIRWNRLFKIVR